MKVSTISFIAFLATCGEAAFLPGISNDRFLPSATARFGYLDDLPAMGVINQEEEESETKLETEKTSKANTNLAPEDVDRFGPGAYEDYVEFDEFDGGDGQMGVAGDGNNQLEKIGSSVTPSLAKSKVMSAKNAWGTSSGYAEKLINERGMDSARAQQLENWHNQQEVLKKSQQQKKMAEEFDQVSDHDEDWRFLAKFGFERNDSFDLDEVFGPVIAGDIEGTVELKARIGQITFHEFQVINEFMGFADFRAAFTPETSMDFKVNPSEGSLKHTDPLDFVIKFKPQNPGLVEGHLVIETEDFKKTWKIIGSTS